MASHQRNCKAAAGKHAMKSQRLLVSQLHFADLLEAAAIVSVLSGTWNMYPRVPGRQAQFFTRHGPQGVLRSHYAYSGLLNIRVEKNSPCTLTLRARPVEQLPLLLETPTISDSHPIPAVAVSDNMFRTIWSGSHSFMEDLGPTKASPKLCTTGAEVTTFLFRSSFSAHSHFTLYRHIFRNFVTE